MESSSRLDVEPAHNGVIANEEYRAEIDPHKPFDTSDFPALDQTDKLASNFLAAPTVAEIVQKAGFRTAIAGSKPVAQLADRSRLRQAEAARESIVVYREKFCRRTPRARSRRSRSLPDSEGFP